MGLLSGVGKLWSGITGSGGENKQSGSQSGTTSGTSAQTTQQSQVQQMLQEIFGQQLTSALQNMQGGGSQQQQQQMQYGLGPQDPFATMGQQGLARFLQGGYQQGAGAQGLQGNVGNFANMINNPSASQSAQSQIAGMTGAAQNLYDQTMKPEIDTGMSRTGMFGSSPWAQARAQGASNLSANLGGQAAGIYGNVANQGMQGLQSAAGLEQYNPYNATMQGWNALAKTGPQTFQTGQFGTGGQQYGQTGGSQQMGTSSQSTLSNMLASMLGSGTATNSGTSTGNFSGSQSTPGSLFGGLQNVMNLLGSGNQGKSTGMASFF